MATRCFWPPAVPLRCKGRARTDRACTWPSPRTPSSTGPTPPRCSQRILQKPIPALSPRLNPWPPISWLGLGFTFASHSLPSPTTAPFPSPTCGCSPNSPENLVPGAPVAKQHRLPHARCPGNGSRRAGRHGSVSRGAVGAAPCRLTSLAGRPGLLPGCLWAARTAMPDSAPGAFRGGCAETVHELHHGHSSANG